MADQEVTRNLRGAYVYEILVDGVVRYVGKGRGKRATSHILIAKRLIRRQSVGDKVRRSRFYASLSEALLSGAEVLSRIASENLSDAEAFDLERETILRAPVGQLWNSAPGGEGQSGEYLSKIWADPAKRELFRQLALSAWARNPDRKLARFAEPGSRERQSAMVREKWADPEYRAKQSLSRAAPRPTRQGVPVPALSAPAKKRWADPAFKARATEAMKATCGTPDYKSKMAAIWTPERLARRGEAIRAGKARKKAERAGR